ncbi:Broad specificity phosphatase PhoE [Caballeronia arationis]|uniref:Broad specificity phosphatase PhoE n=1 Tax=Caballeronia arationis TaxID=1777142 RepID=A0A7Z7N740_9BURK|nr:histidine phosphatase family protein [Caballeronia arationis]SOE91235.1 Broad specificity phosphatase PhoE [Caballeronia arationis]
MAELYLVRHGQASFGAENYDQLSAVGERQAAWLGEYFAAHDIEFDRVVVGTMRRHTQTLDAILGGLGRPVKQIEQHPGLNEYNFRALFDALGNSHHDLKALANGTMRDFYNGLKQVLKLWSEDKLDGPVPETWGEFQRRVRSARQAIQQGHGQKVLAVTSGGAMAVMAQQVLQAPAMAAIELNPQIRNSSFCRFFFNAKACHLASFNSEPHLDRPERPSFQTYA